MVKFDVCFHFTMCFAPNTDHEVEATFFINTVQKRRTEIKQDKYSIAEHLVSVPIFHNDITGELYAFDFKMNDYWVENITYSNDCKTVTCFIC